MQVWNMLHVVRWKYRTQNDAKNRHLGTIPPYHHFVGLHLRNWGIYRQSEKNLLSSNISSTCSHNIVNFGLLAAEIFSGVWGTPATFNGFRVLAALLHGSQVVSISQTLRRCTEGATYVRQGNHHFGHWPTFLVYSIFLQRSTMQALTRIRSHGNWKVYVACNTISKMKDFLVTDSHVHCKSGNILETVQDRGVVTTDH